MSHIEKGARMKKHMRHFILPAVVGLFVAGLGMVHRAEAQIVPIAVARICMQETFGQRIDLRVYSASGEAGPAGVFLVNGIFDLGFACQDPPTSFWPLHGSIVAKGKPWDLKKLDTFRLNYEAGSIDLDAGCVKFKEGLTCRVNDNHPGEDKKKDEIQLAVSCEGFFTNIGFETNFTSSGSWTPIACFEDTEDAQRLSPPSQRMHGYDPVRP
jgi:hypothetical protein